MSTLRRRTFHGELPIAHPQTLPGPSATRARNCKLWSGALEALRGTAFERATTTPTNPPLTIFKYREGVWLEWEQAVDVTRSPVGDDDYDRVFFTGDGYPRVSSNAMITAGGSLPFPSTSYRLGVPAPALTPNLTLGGTATDDEPETRFYVVTYVNSFGEEGPPGPVSSQIEVDPGEYVDVSLPGAPLGNYDIAQVRVYRTTGEFFQFVGGAAVSATTFRDTVTTPAEELPSTTWLEPPDDLVGLIPVAGAFLAGFRNNEVLFSEVGLPHAWPVAYRLPVDYPVVGLATYNNAVVVMTEGVPYVITGADPAAMSKAEVPLHQACVSKAGIVTMARGVVYPSPDGLVYITEGGSGLITEGVFDRDAWQALDPSSMRAVLWERRYLCFYDTGTETGAFVINPDAPQGGVVFVDAPAVGALYNDLLDDAVYLAVDDEIHRWDAGSALTYTWRGRPDNLEFPETLGVAHVRADAYPVTLRLIADGVQQVEASIASDKPVRLGSRVRARTYLLEVEGTSAVYDAAVTSTMRELRELQELQGA